jgi:hypothetical protein
MEARLFIKEIILMFIMHITSLLGLSVLLASTALVIWSSPSKAKGSNFGKAIGLSVFFFSLLSLLCIGFYSYKYWEQGAFDTPAPMGMGMGRGMGMGGMHHEMMQHMENMGAGDKGAMETENKGSIEDNKVPGHSH